MSSPALRVRNLRVCYGDTAVLENLSFSMEHGEMLALLGPSGCGKTTLLLALAGVVEPQSGELLFSGEPLRPRAAALGFIPQSYGLLPWKTVRENCLFCARLRGAPDDGLFESLVGRLGLAPLLGRYPRQLSGGQAQRVALARALMMKPKLLLMDEPFAALDVAAAHRARELSLCLCREQGTTAVVVTHRLEEALFLGSSIAVMEPGGGFALRQENPWQGMKESQDEAAAQECGALSRLLEREILRAAGGREQ